MAGQQHRDGLDEAFVDFLTDVGNGLADAADQLDAIPFKLDGFESAQIRHMADTFRGAAYRAAMSLPGQRATDALNRLDQARAARNSLAARVLAATFTYRIQRAATDGSTEWLDIHGPDWETTTSYADAIGYAITLRAPDRRIRLVESADGFTDNYIPIA